MVLFSYCLFCWTKVTNRSARVREGEKLQYSLTFQSEIGQRRTLGRRHCQIDTYKIRTMMKDKVEDVCWRVMHLSKAINTHTNTHKPLGMPVLALWVGVKGWPGFNHMTSGGTNSQINTHTLKTKYAGACSQMTVLEFHLLYLHLKFTFTIFCLLIVCTTHTYTHMSRKGSLAHSTHKFSDSDLSFSWRRKA